MLLNESQTCAKMIICWLSYRSCLMSYKCVAGGCSRTSGDVLLHRFPKIDRLRKRWSAAVGRYREDWEGPTNMSMLCSMHFEATCYDGETSLRDSLGLAKKRRRLKEGAVSTLFPNAGQVKAGLLSWAEGSLHLLVKETRNLPQKRERARVRI